MKKCDNCCVGLETFEYEGSSEIFEDFNFNSSDHGYFLFFNFCPYCGHKIKLEVEK